MFNEEVWPSSYDDREIDDIIWAEIKDSDSRGDFICYQIHRPQGWQHRDEAVARLQALEGGDRTPVGYGRAVERIRALAESGHAGAMFHMGKFYVHGIGVTQNMRMAEDWYHKAIAAGEMRAASNMGWIYQFGFGDIFPNKEEAFRLLSMGAAAGIPAAKASIGLMCMNGDGCPVDAAKGMQLLLEAFDAGYTNAGNHLADTFFAGQHVPRDIEAGHAWLTKVAEAGDERTMAILGHYLATGSHGKTDVARGVALLEASIAKQYVPAYLWLANLYRHGQGVPKDLEKARDWLQKGSAAGNTGCDKALADMMDAQTPPTAQAPSTLQ